MKKKLVYSLAAIAVFILCVVGAFFLISQFRIRKAIIISEIEFEGGLDFFNNKNILFLDKVNLARVLLEKNSEIQQIKIETQFPDTVVLDVLLRKPVAVVEVGESKQSVDTNGVFLYYPNLKELNLPKIRPASFFPKEKQKGDWRIQKALFFITNLAKNNIFIDSIVVDDEESLFNIFLADDIEALVPLDTNEKITVASLQMIVSRFRIEGKIVKKIDLRFDKPIVVFESGEKISSI